MIDINHFLTRFKGLIKDKSEQKKVIAKVIADSSGVLVDEKSIVLNSNNSITLNCHPVLKSEVFLRKESVIKALNQELKPQRFEELF
jgi:hypothetical protein